MLTFYFKDSNIINEKEMIELQEKKIFKISLIFKLRKCLKNSLI